MCYFRENIFLMKAVYFLFFSFLIVSVDAQDISVSNIWKTYEYRTKGFEGFNSLKDGVHYTGMDGKGSVLTYSILAPEEAGTLLIDAKKLTWKGKPIEIEDYSFNEDESKVLIMTQITQIYRRSYTAIYFLLDLKTGKLEPLSEQHSPQTLAEYSPDGKFVSFIHGNDLFVKNLATGSFTKLTNDGKRNKIINGTTDWVYEEEFSITKAYDWSPDSKNIAFLKFVEKDVKDYSIDFYGELYPDTYKYKYPKAGEDNAKVSAHIVNVGRPKIQPLSLGKYEYIPRIEWSNVSNDLILQTMNRHQDSLTYHRFDFSGKTPKHTVLFIDHSETYVDVNETLFFLPENKGLLICSEKSGYNQMYKIGFDQSVALVGSGEGDVIDLYGISSNGSRVFFTKSTQGGISKTLCSTDLMGKDLKTLSPMEGTMEADFTKGMTYFVGTFSTANQPPVLKLYNPEGTVIRVLEDNHELVEKLAKLSLPSKEFKQFEVNGTALNAWVISPKNFDVSKKYPVYMTVYGGPGHNEVANRWDGNNFMYHQLLAQSGYMVVSVDPRGTQFRGSAFKKCTYLQLGKLETEDIIGTAKYLQSLSYVDKTRIGIMGWSYGGFMSSSAITKGSDVFKMAIAVAPVTNWRYYDNIYTERFMRTPQENPKGYDDNSPINYCEKLTGKYLLIHGTADDNVHFQNSMDMVTAMVKANKQFDFFAYPNKNHGIYGGNTRNHLYSMMYDYILKNL